MFFLSKLFTWIFLSPVLFLLLGSAALICHKQVKLSKALLFSLLILLYCLSITPGRDLLLRPLEQAQTVPTARQWLAADVSIVLGAGVIERHNPRTPFECLPSAGLRRCLEAAYWFRQYPRPIIVCGGTPLRTGKSEAACMAEALIALGIPQSLIILEPYSRNTHENLVNAKTIMHKKQWQHPIVISSAFHLTRAALEVRKLQLGAIVCATDYRCSQTTYTIGDFFPDFKNMYESSQALKEYIGVLYYRIRY